MEEEEGDARYEFEERDGSRLKYFAGEPGSFRAFKIDLNGFFDVS